MADYVSALTGPEMDEALYDMASHTSEAWAVGTRNGEAVTSTDPTYNNNAKYWAGRSRVFNTNAQAAAARAEAAVPSGTAGAVFFDRAQSLTNAQMSQAMANIGGNMTGYNLVDNGWFLINQRATSDPSDRFAYPADRWFIQNAGAVYHLNQNSGITVTLNEGASYSRMRCRTPDVHLRRALNKPITMSINYSGSLRTVTSTIPSSVPAETTTILDLYIKNGATNLARMHIEWATDGFFDTYITFHEASATIRAVKVEIGAVSTLKYDTVPAFADELLRCQRYYMRVQPLAANSPLGMGYAVSATIIRILVPTPVWMYGTPTVYTSNIGNMRIIGNGQSLTPSAAEYNAVTRNGVVVSFTVSGATTNQTYVLSEASGSMLLAFGTENL